MPFSPYDGVNCTLDAGLSPSDTSRDERIRERPKGPADDRGVLRLEIEDITAASEKVLVEGWVRGTGRGSGVEISQRAYVVYTMSADRLASMEVFFELAEARRAAGLG